MVPKERLCTVGAQQFTSDLMLREVRMDEARYKEYLMRSLGRRIGDELVFNKSNGVQLKEEPYCNGMGMGTLFRMGVTIVKEKE